MASSSTAPDVAPDAGVNQDQKNVWRARLIWAAVTLGMTLAAGMMVDRLRSGAQTTALAIALTTGDPGRAPLLFRRYGCTGCHSIPGIPGADGKVGGSLQGLRERVYIAGTLNNTGDALVSFIVDPQRFSPRLAMPATGITHEDARHLAAYLYAH